MSGVALLLTASLALGQPTEADLQREAETAFAEGVALRGSPDADAAREKFRLAAGKYEELRQRGCDNPELYLSQGNAYYLADDLPRAILAYRRGLRLDPAHPGLQDNLEAARVRVVQSTPSDLGRPPVEDRPPWLPRLRLSVWSGAAVLLLYTLGWLALLRWAMVRKWLWVTAGASILVLSAGVTWVLYLDAAAEQAEREAPLVVVADQGVLLRTGNEFAYPAKYDDPLPRGAEARLRHERGDWVQIELSGGEVGWVPREYVLIDRDGG